MYTDGLLRTILWSNTEKWPVLAFTEVRVRLTLGFGSVTGLSKNVRSLESLEQERRRSGVSNVRSVRTCVGDYFRTRVKTRELVRERSRTWREEGLRVHKGRDWTKSRISIKVTTEGTGRINFEEGWRVGEGVRIIRLREKGRNQTAIDRDKRHFHVNWNKQTNNKNEWRARGGVGDLTFKVLMCTDGLLGTILQSNTEKWSVLVMFTELKVKLIVIHRVLSLSYLWTTY